jgi:hypothetical protein
VAVPVALAHVVTNWFRRRIMDPCDRLAVALLGFVALSYVLWLRTFAIYRYALVLEALSGVSLLIACVRICAGNLIAILGIIAASTIVANIWVTRPDWGHVPYSDGVIEMRPLNVPHGALVLFADGGAHSYLLSFMPSDVRGLGINNNLITPGAHHGLNSRIERLIREHTGPIVAITEPATSAHDLTKSLSVYGLTLRDCHLHRTNIEPDGHRICDVVRQ